MYKNTEHYTYPCQNINKRLTLKLLVPIVTTQYLPPKVENSYNLHNSLVSKKSHNKAYFLPKLF